MNRLLIFLVFLLPSWPALAEPFVPQDDAVVLERLPPSVDDELRQLRADLAADPENLPAALELARRYLEIARREGDPRWTGYAQAVLAPWWDEDPPPPGVLLLRATLRQNRHDFDGALDDLTRLLRADPRNAQAWLTRATILQVRGDYGRAFESCAAFQRLSRSLLATACLANVASLTGRAEGAYRLLEHAIETAPEDAGHRAWILTAAAQIAERLGRYGDAEQRYREALELGAGDLYLLAAYADFLLDRGRAREASELLTGETRADALLLRLALAESRLGSPKLEGRVRDLTARFAAGGRRGEATHLGGQARFYLHLLDRPGEALELALANWDVQREPVDARLVLEAALAAGDPQAARPVADWIAETGLEDVRLARLIQQLETPRRPIGS